MPAAPYALIAALLTAFGLAAYTELRLKRLEAPGLAQGLGEAAILLITLTSLLFFMSALRWISHSQARMGVAGLLLVSAAEAGRLWRARRRPGAGHAMQSAAARGDEAVRLPPRIGIATAGAGSPGASPRYGPSRNRKAPSRGVGS